MHNFYCGSGYTTAELRRWARAMRYFRICGTMGGHFDDGDSLRVLLGGMTLEQSLDAFRARGASVALKDPADTSSSRWVFVDGTELYIVGMSNGNTGLMVYQGATDAYTINDAMVAAAAAFERWLDPLAAKIIDPPYDAPNRCISPKTHPEIWGQGSGNREEDL